MTKRSGSAFYVTLGQRLAFIRRTACKSQSDIAEYLDISVQQLQKYENGTNRIPVDRLVSLSRYFGLTMDTMVARIDPPQ